MSETTNKNQGSQQRSGAEERISEGKIRRCHWSKLRGRKETGRSHRMPQMSSQKAAIVSPLSEAELQRLLHHPHRATGVTSQPLSRPSSISEQIELKTMEKVNPEVIPGQFPPCMSSRTSYSPGQTGALQCSSIPNPQTLACPWCSHILISGFCLSPSEERGRNSPLRGRDQPVHACILCWRLAQGRTVIARPAPFLGVKEACFLPTSFHFACSKGILRI